MPSPIQRHYIERSQGRRGGEGAEKEPVIVSPQREEQRVFDPKQRVP